MTSKLEEALAQQLDFAAKDANGRWPYSAPVRELHFDWCCEHTKNEHGCEFCQTCHLCEEMHAFHRGRAWRFDFAWPLLKVAVECDGGTRSGGRHVRGDGFAKDMEKLNAAALQGWKVLRCTQREITSGEILHQVEQALREARQPFSGQASYSNCLRTWGCW